MDLRAVYDVLSTAERLTAAIAGVVSPVPYEARELARMLRTADVRVDKRHLTVAAVEKACRALQRRGVLFGLRGSDHVVAAPLWAPWLTLEARQVDLLERLWAAFQADRSSYYWHFWEQQAQRDAAQLRYATVTGRFELVPDKTKPGSWTFLAQPGALGLLESLPERYRQMALRGCLDEAVNLAANPDPVIAACREHAHDLEPFAADIALLRVLQGASTKSRRSSNNCRRRGSQQAGPRRAHRGRGSGGDAARRRRCRVAGDRGSDRHRKGGHQEAKRVSGVGAVRAVAAVPGAGRHCVGAQPAHGAGHHRTAAAGRRADRVGGSVRRGTACRCRRGPSNRGGRAGIVPEPRCWTAGRTAGPSLAGT